MKRKRHPEPDSAADPPRVTRPHSDAPMPLASGGLVGPALRLSGQAPLRDTRPNGPSRSGNDETPLPPAPALRAPVGKATRHAVFGGSGSVRLHGLTEATFDGGRYSITGETRARAEGCDNCTEGCLRVRGTLVATYRVTTTVTLPSVNDYSDLTPCQRERVAAAIRDVLAPHEQDHVRAFETYNGTTRTRFDLTGCNAEEINAQLQEIHNRQASARAATARALSDALDPFHFEVDLDCEDEEPEREEPDAPEAEPDDDEKADDEGDTP